MVVGLVILLALYVMFMWPAYSRIVLGEEVTPSVGDFKNQIREAVDEAREDWRKKNNEKK